MKACERQKGIYFILESGNKANDAFVEAIKGVRRMPRYREAMKDVSGCEKYRRAAKKALTR